MPALRAATTANTSTKRCDMLETATALPERRRES